MANVQFGGDQSTTSTDPYSFPWSFDMSSYAPSASGSGSLAIGSRATKVSKNNSTLLPLLGFPGADVGGPFYKESWEVTTVPSSVSWFKSGNGRYSGSIIGASSGVPGIFDSSYASLPFSQSDLDLLIGKGTAAIAEVEPTKSRAQLATALLEAFHDGIPRIIGSRTWKDRTFRARQAGDEYLNYAFGWKPLVNDVRDFASAVANSHSIMERYNAQLGNVIHRRFTFPQDSTSSFGRLDVSPKVPSGIPYPQSGYVNTLVPTVDCHWSSTTTVSTWFSGAFRVPGPDPSFFGNLGGHYRKASYLLGLDLSPETLWNLVPWSWAADWFGNIGSILHNLNALAFNGVAMDYGYMMMHHTVKTNLSFFVKSPVSGVSGQFAGQPLGSQSFVQDRKIRIKASPFGFNVDWPDFTPAQLAIAASLGVTRGDSNNLGVRR